MAEEELDQGGTVIDYSDFVDIVNEANQLYSRLVEDTPYVDFIEDAHREEASFWAPGFSDLKSHDFKKFLSKAQNFPENYWDEKKEFIIPAAVRIEKFNELASTILTRINKIREDTVDYEQIKKRVISSPARKEADGWYQALKQVFDYFKDYSTYLNGAIEVTSIAQLTDEAKETLEATKEVADAQERMLERSGALSRANVYYELAYGKKPDEANYSRKDWLKLKPFRFVHGYRQVARWWLVAIAGSVLLTSVVALILYVVMKIDFQKSAFEVITLVAVKALVLLPLFYLIRFTVHSYRVNKHLEVLYTHRWALHQTLDSYLELADREGKPSDIRAKQLTEITPFFYSEIETGYINKKEGLGDKSIEVIPEGIFKALSKN